ncbi:MAG: phytanoyl-CoA dioxygenase family protein [Acidimicrobiales bacterium]
MAGREFGTGGRPAGVRGSIAYAIRSASSYRVQAALRLPSPRYRLRFAPPGEEDRATDVLGTFKRDGIVVLPAFIEEPRLGRVQAAFAAAVQEPSAEIRDALEDNDVLRTAPAFLDVALDDLVLDVVARYYRRPYFVGRAKACRLLPSEPAHYGSFQWHHDTRGKQAKMMVLLNGVDPEGQRMRYRRGTHKHFYSYDRMYGPASRFEDDLQHESTNGGDIVEVVGPPGTIALFDSNGLHSGTRNLAAPRDTLIVSYTTGRNVRPLHYRRSDLAALPAAKRRIVTANPKHVLV